MLVEDGRYCKKCPVFVQGRNFLHANSKDFALEFKARPKEHAQMKHATVDWMKLKNKGKLAGNWRPTIEPRQETAPPSISSLLYYPSRLTNEQI